MPCVVETQGLKIEIISIKLLFLILLLSFEVFPQIPINGFCKFNKFDVDSGFTSLFPLNYNGDSYTDLVLFNQSKKEIESLTGEQSGSFETPRNSRTPSEISRIQGMTDHNNNITGYVYCSRKRMKSGMISFSKNGKPSFQQEIKLKSYPDNIAIADLSGNGNSAILLSGRSFDGLSLLNIQNKKLKESRIINNTVYSFAQFMDINHDGLPDIAAFNLTSQCLDLFYNKGNQDYSKTQSFPVTEQIYSLKTSDIDLDSYEDIVVSKRNSIEIFYGSFNSSFDNRKVIATEYNPERIITGDFNKDGKIDIAYLDTKTGVLSVLFGKDNRDFYPEVIYFRKEGCSDLIPFYSKFINGIAVLNKNGSLYTLTNFTGVSEEINISLGVSQQGLNYFDHNHDRIPDLCFIDNTEHRLNLILRNSSGVPDIYYSIPLNGTFAKVYSDNYRDNATFYCYSAGEKLIEEVNLDYKHSTYDKKSFYVRNGIKNIRAEHNGNSEVKLYVVQLEKKKLSATVFNNISINYLNSNFFISDNVVDASSGEGSNSDLYFWQNKKDSLTLYSSSYTNNFQYPEFRYSVRQTGMRGILSFTGDFISSKNEAYYGIIKSNEPYTTVLLSRNMNLSANHIDPAAGLPDNNELYYTGAMNFKGTDKIFFNSPDEGLIKRIDIINRGRNFSISTVTDAQFAVDYFIKNLNLRNYHLVYIDSRENCITIKPIQ